MTGLGLPRADRPKEVGLSTKRLARLSATFRQDVERNMIPEAVVPIARGGRIAYALRRPIDDEIASLRSQ